MSSKREQQRLREVVEYINKAEAIVGTYTLAELDAKSFGYDHGRPLSLIQTVDTAEHAPASVHQTITGGRRILVDQRPCCPALV